MAFQSWTSCDISSNLKHLTDMHGCVFVCVQNLFAHGDKQLLCTPGPNPGLRMAAAHGLMEHSHPLLHSTELAAAGSSQCALRDPRHACACLGVFFGAWHSSPHTCQHFLSLSSFFHLCSKLPLIVQVKYRSTQPTETSDLIDVRTHGEDEDGEDRFTLKLTT